MAHGGLFEKHFKRHRLHLPSTSAHQNTQGASDNHGQNYGMPATAQPQNQPQQIFPRQQRRFLTWDSQ